MVSELQNEMSAAGRDARLLRFARNDGGYVVVKRQTLSLRGAQLARRSNLCHAGRRLRPSAFWRNEPEK